MEQQEKKKRKGNRRKRERTQSKLSLPVELISEILSRLPGKSVARFRCVSKLWSSIRTDPYFINSFETHSSTRPSVLLCFQKRDKLFVSSIPQHAHSLHPSSNKAYSSSLLIDSYHMKLMGYGFHDHTESVHGLICIEGYPNPIVWNPSMRKFLTLPNPNNHKTWKKVTLFLGYDPIEGKHKVVCIRYKKVSYVFRVLTLGSAQESWRTVKTNHKHYASYYTYGRCINGVIYYLAGDHITCDMILISFDVRSEKFDKIELRPDMRLSDVRADVLITYKGSLACTDEKKKRRLWILEDAEKHKWSSQDFLLPLRHRDPSLKTHFNLAGFTHDGDGVGNRRLYELSCFPNHIESLMSLVTIS